MKVILLAVGLLAAPAFANDGGVPYIKVDKVARKTNGDVVIKGAEAFKLYQILPRDFVIDVTRSLTITSDRRKVVISCNTSALAASPEDNPKPDPSKVECQISTGGPYDPAQDEGDHFVWEPNICERR
jgi:hypothetical protein